MLTKRLGRFSCGVRLCIRFQSVCWSEIGICTFWHRQTAIVSLKQKARHSPRGRSSLYCQEVILQTDTTVIYIITAASGHCPAVTCIGSKYTYMWGSERLVNWKDLIAFQVVCSHVRLHGPNAHHCLNLPEKGILHPTVHLILSSACWLSNRKLLVDIHRLCSHTPDLHW